MAKPSTVQFKDFVVLLEDPDAPGTYIAPCGFTQKAMKLSSQSSQAVLPDCDDPEAPAWTATAVASLSGQVTGSGVMAKESFNIWRRWLESGASRNIKIAIADTPGGLGHYAGAAVLTDFQLSGQLNSEGNRLQVQVTVDNDSQWTWTDAA